MENKTMEQFKTVLIAALAGLFDKTNGWKTVIGVTGVAASLALGQLGWIDREWTIGLVGVFTSATGIGFTHKASKKKGGG